MYTHQDTTDPVFDTLPEDRSVECDGAGNSSDFTEWLAEPVVTDSCHGDLEVTNDATMPVYCDSVLITFMATDDCLHSVSATASFAITDSVNPFFATAPQDRTVECNGAGNLADFNGWIEDRANAVGGDLCSSTTISAGSGTAPTDAPCPPGTSSTTVLFTVSDQCGNSFGQTATFTISDTTAPSVDVPPQSQSVQCSDTSSAQFDSWLSSNAGLSASDVCSSFSTSINHGSGSLESSCLSSATITGCLRKLNPSNCNLHNIG